MIINEITIYYRANTGVSVAKKMFFDNDDFSLDKIIIEFSKEHNIPSDSFFKSYGIYHIRRIIKETN